MKLSIFCDGGARGNPGPAAVGVVVCDSYGRVISQFGKKIGHNTNNIAEYMGVIEALRYLKPRIQNSELIIQKLDFFLDSKLVVNQLNGIYKIKKPSLRELLFTIRNLEQELGVKIFYHFVPREKNSAHLLVEQTFLL